MILFNLNKCFTVVYFFYLFLNYHCSVYCRPQMRQTLFCSQFVWISRKRERLDIEIEREREREKRATERWEGERERGEG